MGTSYHHTDSHTLYNYHYSDSMALDLINPHVTKILLAIVDGDSIKTISKKTGGSYGWTHHWIERLESIGVIDQDDGIRIDDEELADRYREVAAAVVSRQCELDDAYVLPNFSGMEYRFSKTDAVYHWTKGGYQIGRNRRDYPIFIDIMTTEISDWQNFFDRFGLVTSIEERVQEDDPGIYYVLFPRKGFESTRVGNASITPLDETVDWAGEFATNFQPALEMLDEMYDLGLGIEYRERKLL